MTKTEKKCKNCHVTLAKVELGDEKSRRTVWMHTAPGSTYNDYRPQYYQYCRLQIAQP